MFGAVQQHIGALLLLGRERNGQRNVAAALDHVQHVDHAANVVGRAAGQVELRVAHGAGPIGDQQDGRLLRGLATHTILSHGASLLAYGAT